jgi:hypothetical protein
MKSLRMDGPNRWRVIHAAALVLVGWYLMVPPWPVASDPNSSDVVPDVTASLGRWTTERAFDSARECEHWLDTRKVKARKEFQNPQKQEDPSSGPETLLAKKQAAEPLYARCIATDDPRLKEK